jgi:hypothetical protein
VELVPGKVEAHQQFRVAEKAWGQLLELIVREKELGGEKPQVKL